MPELKPCPFCGVIPTPRHEKREGTDWWWVDCTKARSEDCPAMCYTGAPTEREVIERWNRRTPDLTEALARLKALEEEMRRHSFVCTKCGASWHDSGGGSNLCTACGYLAVDCGGKDKWADEIAAIRGKLGASESEP